MLVTDRDDLDKQLGNTFAACGLDAGPRHDSGRDLLELVSEQKAGIVTTLIHKFDKALNVKEISGRVHRYLHADRREPSHQFRRPSPRACARCFPRPVIWALPARLCMKTEKNNFAKFGGLIEPHYSIQQAVKDGAVVPSAL